MDNARVTTETGHPGLVDPSSWLYALIGLVASLGPSGQWAPTLDTLDAQRNDAFVRLQPELLTRVYPRVSDLLAADRRAIASYRSRGLRVDRVSMRLLDVDLINERGGRVRLHVVDQLRPVRVRRPGGAWRALPRDEPTERVVVLLRSPAGWRITRSTRLAG